MKKRMIFFFLGLVCLFGRVEIVVGQKVADYPDSSAEKVGGAPVVVYGEIISQNGINEVSIKVFTDYYTDHTVGPGIIHEVLPTSSSNQFLGQAPRITYNFQWTSPPLEELTFITLSNGYKKILDNYLFAPGDTAYIKIDLNKAAINFGGPAGQKLTAQYQQKLFEGNKALEAPVVITLNSIEEVLQNEVSKANHEWAKSIPVREIKLIEPGEQALQEAIFLLEKGVKEPLDFLSQNKWVYSQREFDFLKTTILCNHYNYTLAKLGSALIASIKNKDNDLWQESIQVFDHYFGQVPLAEMDEEVRYRHPEYIQYLQLWAKTKGLVTNRSQLDVLYSIPPSSYRDKAITGRLMTLFNILESPEEEVKAALNNIQTSLVKKELQKFLTTRSANGKTMSFEFPDIEGNLVSWRDFLGKVVLLEFYISGCSVSKAFYSQALQPVSKEFRNNPEVEIVTVSVDPTREDWVNSLATGLYTNDTATNLYTGGHGARHPFLIEYTTPGFPFIFLLDREGKIFRSGKIPFNSDDLKALIQDALSQ